MAGVERFELPTRGFGIRCSANWSYTPADSYALDSKKPRIARFSNKVAERTGLEPATPGVTGRYSNRLNYRSAACLG